MPAIPKPPSPSSSRDKFIWAISQQESGGNYKAVGPNISGDHAYGKYQVMGSNIPSWTKAALGHSLTIQQFLNDPGAQEATVAYKLGGYYDRYGPAGAAAMWYSGQPDPSKTYGDPPVYKYVQSVLSIMNGAPANVPAGGAASATDAGYGSTDKPADCLVGFSVGIGYVCVLTKGQGRAVAGALLLAAGGVVTGAGLIILAAYGLKKSGALDAAASAAAVIPGAGGLAAKAAGAAGAVKRTPEQAAASHRRKKQARAAKKSESESEGS